MVEAIHKLITDINSHEAGKTEVVSYLSPKLAQELSHLKKEVVINLNGFLIP